MYPLASVHWAALKTVLTRDLATALRLKGGVPKRLLQHFVKETTKWLAEGERAEALPLFSHEALRDTIIGPDREKTAGGRSAKKLTAREERTQGTITTALTKRRELPFARQSETGAETILVPLEISVGEERLQLELSGPLQKHRVGLGFPDDPDVGFLARILVGEASRLSGKSVPASATSRPTTPRAMQGRSFLSTDDSNVLSQLLDLPSRIADQLSLTQPLRTPWGTPPPARDFSGRDDELLELLNAHETRNFSIIGVQGPSGVGKTALALAVVERLRSRYQSTIFLNLNGNLEQPLSAPDVMRHVIHAYQPGRSLPDDTAALSGLYHSTLHDRDALLVFDNAADTARRDSLLGVAIGECKSDGGEINDNDCKKLLATATALNALKVISDIYLIFAKTADSFTAEEVARFKELASEKHVQMILLTNRELELYHPYWLEDGQIENDVPERYPHSLSDLARNSAARYLR